MSRRERAIALRRAGGTYPQIAASIGVSSSTVQRWCKPDYEERQRAGSRAWKDTHREAVRAYDAEYARRLDIRGTCEACGGPMGAKVCRDGICLACRSRAREDAWKKIQTLWAQGLSLIAIAGRLGWTVNHVGTEMAAIRNAGWDLPHRYKIRPRVAA